MRMRTALAGGVAGVLADHERILEACRRRDADAAVKSIREHIVRAQEQLLEEWRADRCEGASRSTGARLRSAPAEQSVNDRSSGSEGA